MNKFRKAHKIIAIVALFVSIVAYFLQLIYFVTFFALADAPVTSPADEAYHTSLFCFLVLEMIVCIGIVAYSAYSIYRAWYDDDSVKQGPDVMFIAFFVGFLYMLNGFQSLSYYAIFQKPVDVITILTVVLSILSILFYIPLFLITNATSKTITIIRYILRLLIMACVGTCIILNVAYFASYDGFAIAIATIELLVPLAVGTLLVSEA